VNGPARGLSLLALVVAGLSGCLGLGSSAISRDRVDYSTAIAESQKRQTLLNIVKLRYVDAPVFLDVAQIVGGYTMESTFSATGTIFNVSGVVPGVPNSSVGLGAQGRFTERPTITYTPLTGPQFSRNILTPIPPAAILFLLQAGWPADLVLPLTVDSINGLQNRVGTPARMHPGDPEFWQLIDLLRKIQRSNAVGMRVEPRQDKQGKPEDVIVTFRLRAVPPEIAQAQAEARALLGLSADATDFRVVYGTSPPSGDQIAMMTRSIIQILIELATLVDVPPAHLAERRAAPTLPAPEGKVQPLIRIVSSSEAPTDGFVSVRYRDHWYWIDDRDLLSKRTFSFLIILFSLADTGGRESLPLVTIPAG
jgi:hypothetical protein